MIWTSCDDIASIPENSQAKIRNHHNGGSLITMVTSSKFTKSSPQLRVHFSASQQPQVDKLSSMKSLGLDKMTRWRSNRAIEPKELIQIQVTAGIMIRRLWQQLALYWYSLEDLILVILCQSCHRTSLLGVRPPVWLYQCLWGKGKLYIINQAFMLIFFTHITHTPESRWSGKPTRFLITSWPSESR